eukprot:gb/GFBE01059681.1/.p1 GENE.gb/GFBE01059681.1/~~gb/GFBE01059681.1/.p1  ORF type:complete len:253 (+),score=55.72 gb/GFBE01059681.1/:1-759(+)
MAAAALVARARGRSLGGLGAACRMSPRCFAWSTDQTELEFKVKADGFDLNKLAGGISMRTNQRQVTILEGMGEKSIYNCVKALVLVNKFAEWRREDKEANPDKVPWFNRVGFVPSLRKNGEMQWVSLRVVPIEEPYSPSSSSECMRLRVGNTTPMMALQKAILNEWLQRCAGSKGEPFLCAMGAKGVSTGVKSAAKCLKELSLRKGAARNFLCFPEMVQEELPVKGELVTLTQIRLEPRERRLGTEIERRVD